LLATNPLPENNHAIQEPSLLETRLLPQKQQLSFIPFSQIILGKKTVINLLSIPVPGLLQLCCVPNPGNVLHQLQPLAPPEADEQLFHPLVQLSLLGSEPGRTCPNFEGIP
uniref:Uncharacterized protein n=1 Tax=Cyanoderma ruficeps TaxID=181631 RepID=A0A8C3P3M4_9PASS